MKKKETENRGGAGRGQGNKPGSVRVEERRRSYPLSALPSIIEEFKARYGRAWSRRIEELIKEDLARY